MFAGVNNVVVFVEGRHPNDFEIGFIIESVVVFVAIIYRYNLYKKDKEKLLVQVTDQQQNLMTNIVNAEEEERRRIATDLHNDVGSTLNRLNLHISNKPASIHYNGLIENYFNKAIELSNKATSDVRNIAHNLIPKDFKSDGFFSTLQKRIDELNAIVPMQIMLIKEGDERLLTDVFSIMVYRIINELLNNTIKHSKASEAVIQIFIEKDNVQIMTEDNGVGFDQDNLKDGIGLRSIKSRVEYLKGEINIDSNNEGTQTIIEFPLHV